VIVTDKLQEHLAAIEVDNRHKVQRPCIRIVRWFGVQIHEQLNEGRRSAALWRQVLHAQAQNLSAIFHNNVHDLLHIWFDLQKTSMPFGIAALQVWHFQYQ
jgi:hypothetical protein